MQCTSYNGSGRLPLLSLPMLYFPCSLPEGIDTRFYYDPPVHTHQAFRDLATSGEDPLTTTMEITKKTITIPVYSDMTDEQAEGVCRAVERLHHHAEQVREQSRRGALTG